MRHLTVVKGLSIGLLALAAAGCGGPAANTMAGNDANETAPAATAAPAANNAAEANAAAPAGNEAAGANETYGASGSEPFWSLTIGGGQMVYHPADGPDVTVATPAQQPTRAGYRYVTPQMEVSVNTFQRCTADNDAEYHDTVRVTIGEQTVTGCGGAVTRAAE